MADAKQSATFTKWINAQFQKAGVEDRVSELTNDLQSGILLIKLMSSFQPADAKQPAYNKAPKNQLACLNNLSVAFEMIQKQIKLGGVGPENIYDKNEKLVLGLIWQIIYAVQIGGIKGEDTKSSGKEGLRLWVQRQVKGHEGCPDITNFTTSWKNGLALAALIHANRPTDLDYEAVRKQDADTIIKTCFDVAEKKLGIARLLEVEDLTTTPDEKSTMTYISEFFHVFTTKNTAEDSKRRLGQFIGGVLAVGTMVGDYEAGARDVLQQMQTQKKELQAQKGNEKDVAEARKHLDAAKDFRYSKRRELLDALNGLELSLSNIHTFNRTNNRPAYTPPKDIESLQLKQAWESLEDAESKNMDTAKENYRKAKQDALKSYDEAAGKLQKLVETQRTALGKLSGELDVQLKEVNTLHTAVANAADFQAAKKLAEQLKEAGVTTDDLAYPWEDLSWEWESVSQAITKKKAFVETQVAAKKAGDVTAEKMQEYRESFDFFDENKNNQLSCEEFENCMKSLGVSLQESEIQAQFKKYAKGSSMDFDGFVRFMKDTTVDTQSKDQVLASFAEFAKNDQFITEEQLKAFAGEKEFTYLKANMPKSDKGFDYRAYVSKVFGA